MPKDLAEANQIVQDWKSEVDKALAAAANPGTASAGDLPGYINALNRSINAREYVDKALNDAGHLYRTNNEKNALTTLNAESLAQKAAAEKKKAAELEAKNTATPMSAADKSKYFPSTGWKKV